MTALRKKPRMVKSYSKISQKGKVAQKLVNKSKSAGIIIRVLMSFQ